jgi:hypothetical protein
MIVSRKFSNKNVEKRQKLSKIVNISGTVDRGDNFILSKCHYFAVFHLVVKFRSDPTVNTPEVAPVGNFGYTTQIY